MVKVTQADEWRAAVDDALVQNFHTADEFDTPRDAIHWLIEREQRIALAPAVSAEARALFVRGIKAGLEAAAKACENLGFFTDIDELMHMTKQDMSERTCHEAAAAIRNIDPESVGE